MVKHAKVAARRKANGRQLKPTAAGAAREYFKALSVPPDAIPRLVGKVRGQEVLWAECDRLADEWHRDQGCHTWLEVLRVKPPVSLPPLLSFRANVALWRRWYRSSPGDFLDLAGKLRELWNEAPCVESMGPPPPLPATALGVMPGQDRAAVEIALAALESLLRWCDGAEQPAVSDATDTSDGEDYVWLNATEAATYVGRCSKTIANWIREGTLRSFGQSGAQYQFLKSELDAKKSARKSRKPR